MADRELSTILNSGEVNSIFLGGVTSDDAVKKKSDNDALYQDLAGNSAITKTKFTPQATPPAYVKGTVYYNSVTDTLNIQGPYSDQELQLGHQQHIHIINNSGVIIEKGSACRHDGVSVGGIVQVQKAIATSFVNARIFGIATEEIAIGAEGTITTFGAISGVDTSGVTAGVPLYLSDTVAGTWTETAPTIISQVGGALTSDASGELFISIINNTNLPNIYGGLQGQILPSYALTTTAQDIVNYTTETEAVVTVDSTTGVITLPNAGAYRQNFTASISFTSSTSTRAVYFEVYDVTGAAIAYTYTKNIPRDATEDSLSFSFPAQAVVNNDIKMRVRASTAMSITFDSIVFDIESVSIS